MNTRKLHIGGTFKNALAKKIDSVIIPLFAEVIAIIDHNQNLHHLKELGKRQCAIHDLWLHIFSTPELFSFNFAEIAGREKAPVNDDFCCKFPFSWLIKEAVDNQMENVISGKVYVLIHHIYNYICYHKSSLNKSGVNKVDSFCSSVLFVHYPARLPHTHFTGWCKRVGLQQDYNMNVNIRLMLHKRYIKHMIRDTTIYRSIKRPVLSTVFYFFSNIDWRTSP